MKLWNEGIACSMPLSEEEDEPCERSGGRLSEPGGCGGRGEGEGEGIFQPGVAVYMDAGFASTYMLSRSRWSAAGRWVAEREET